MCYLPLPLLKSSARPFLLCAINVRLCRQLEFGVSSPAERCCPCLLPHLCYLTSRLSKPWHKIKMQLYGAARGLEILAS